MSADELDVDAELLAMAGDSSDDESDAGDTGEEMNEAEVLESPRTPSQEPKTSVEKVPEDPSSARRGVAQKVRKNRRKRDRKREIEDELDDLGDGSPSPQPSASDPMSDSEADAPASPEEVDDAPLYPLEGRFLSAQDREQILALPEVERESILADRAQEVLRRQQDIALKQQMAATAAAQSKRKRKPADLDDGARKTSRPKTEKTGASALDNYKKAREAKGAERTSRIDSSRDKRRSRSASSASDRDADGESEVEWAEPSRRDKDEPPPELKDFDRCRIGRSAFSKICFYPNFEETMKGCYARVSIGMNRETGQNMYRMTQIKDFTSGKPYTLETPLGKTFQTDQYAVVAHGTAEKPWPFSACSDSRFTELELQRYKDTLDKERLRLPRRGWLLNKLEDIHKFLDPEWNDNNLSIKFRKQKEMERRLNPANAAKIKREAITKRLREAEDLADADEIARCEAELSALDNQETASATARNGSPSSKPKPSPSLNRQTSNPTSSQTNSHQDRLALLNQKNRGKNADDVRKALLEERKKLQREREKALAEKAEKVAREKAEAERKALLGVPGDDYGDLFGSDISRAGTPMSGISTPKIRRSRAGTPVNGVGAGVKEKKGLSMVVNAGKRGGKKVDDELGDLDLGIDVEI